MSNLSELLPSGGAQNVVDFVASGTLPNGKPVILNSNGTVTVVNQTSTSEPEVIPLGGEVAFSSGGIVDYPVVAYDLNNPNKFVVVYRDPNNGKSGTATIGSVSGSSITFGSNYVFNSGETNYISVAYDPNTADKFVVTYEDNADSNYGRSLVGTVSGTAISFGSETVFNSATTYYNDIAFDPNSADKFVVVYQDSGNSGYGTAVVGTISGSSISYGSEYVFNSGNSRWVVATFDPNNANKVIVAFEDVSSSTHGKVVVGTVSGTSLSFSSEYTFNAAATSDISMDFDPNTADKFIVAYQDGGNNSYGKAIIGSLSGSTASFGSEYTFNASSTYDTGVAFDPNTANKFVVCYSDSSGETGSVNVGVVSGTALTYGTQIIMNSGVTTNLSISFNPEILNRNKFVVCYSEGTYGRVRMGQLAHTVLTTNLTATNLIGISAEAIASGATGKVNVLGGLNEGQSSLTPLSIYYVQENGTITTASASPAQKIGKAMSATTLNIKDL